MSERVEKVRGCLHCRFWEAWRRQRDGGHYMACGIAKTPICDIERIPKWTMEPPPDWCPLRQGPVRVELADDVR